MTDRCPCCASRLTTSVVTTPPLPVNACNLVYSAAESRASKKLPIDLKSCAGCGFLWNATFDETAVRYDQAYEGTQIHSGFFRDYLHQTAGAWVDAFCPGVETILEVGCGQGEFLEALAGRTDARLIGCDPAFRGLTTGPVKIMAQTLQELKQEECDVVINRMTLEHIPNPHDFLTDMAAWVSDDGLLITQVPNAARMVEKSLYCDLIYEHVNYFNAFALDQLLKRVGFRDNHYELSYDDQHLTVFSRRAPATAASEGRLPKPDTQKFDADTAAFSNRWQGRLEAFFADGFEVYVWGAGSRATTFLNSLATPDLVSGVIDINPRRNGTYVQGTDCITSSADILSGKRNLKIVIMNPIYEAEISRTLHDISADAELVY